MITKKEVLMGRELQYPLTPEMEANLNKLITAVNGIRGVYGKPMVVSSGYRPGAFNEAANGAKKSAHMVCMAVDFRDPDGKLDEWLSNNQDLLEKLDLWQEHPSATQGWAHLDTKPRAIKSRPGCKKRQFNP